MFSKSYLSPLLGAFLISTSCIASDWTSREWLRLGRYHKGLFGGYESEADGPSFFLHVEGRTNPAIEYQTLLEEIQKPVGSDVNKHAICRFPARTEFMVRAHPEIKATTVTCNEFERFRDRVSARSISLVFSSYYLNNPASSFGHTFVRLGKDPFEKSQNTISTELLDTGINYGANTGNANAVTFALGAFGGLFYGSYNSIPYYYKVREYNDFESRDLWTYHLDFTQPEIDQLVRHIWELGHAEFKYFFLTENCSYHALTMLEAVRPSLELVKYLPKRYIIPTDTLKVIIKQKIVKQITYRPSASTTFYHHLNKLSPEEKIEMKNVLEQKETSKKLSPEKKALVYDSALSFIDYKYAEEILKDEKVAQGLKRPILLARSQIPVRSPELDLLHESHDKPHEGHDSGRLSLGGSEVNEKTVANIGYRFAFHDFLDYQKAYIPHSKVEMFSFKSTTDGKNFSITDANIADYYSLGSFDEYTKSFSWKLKFGQWQTFQEGIRGFTTHGSQFGYGYSYQSRYLTPFLLGTGEASYVSEHFHKFKFTYGFDVGFLVNFSENLLFSTFYEQRFHPWEETYSKNEMRLSNVDHAVSILYNAQTKIGFSEIGLNYMIYLK